MCNKSAELLEATIRAHFDKVLHLGDMDEVFVAYASNEAWTVVIQPYAEKAGEVENATYVHVIMSDGDETIPFYRQSPHPEWPDQVDVPWPDLELEAAAQHEDAGLTLHCKVYGKGWVQAMTGMSSRQAEELKAYLTAHQSVGVYAFAITMDATNPDEPSYTIND